MLLLFVLVPFAYFFVADEDETLTKKQRACDGVKFGIVSVVLLIVLFLVGMFVRTGSSGASSGPTRRWFDALDNLFTQYEEAIAFVVSALMFVGLVVSTCYTAWGLSSLPVNVILGKRKVRLHIGSVKRSIEETQERQRLISSRYAGGHTMSKEDKRALQELKAQERLLKKRVSRLEASENVPSGRCSSCLTRLEPCMLPLRIVGGVVLFLLAMLGFASMFVTQLDALLHSSCGAKCGYILDHPHYLNPLDRLLSVLAPYFPLDAFVVAIIVFYFFGATLSGFYDLGVRALWKKIADLRTHRTPPAGIVLLGMLTSLAMLFMTQQFLTMAPGYFGYGSQTYSDVNGTVHHCELAGSLADCHLTQTAAMVHVATGVTHNFVGVALYFGTWAFMLCWLVFAGIAIYKSCTRKVAYGTTLDGKDVEISDDAHLEDPNITQGGVLV